MDLDINNYKLEDLLKLFHMNYDFNEDDLKFAKKIMLKTHPDKSKYDPKIFRFYKQAYDIVENIYIFKNKMNKKTENNVESYQTVLGDNKEESLLLDNFFRDNKHLTDNKKDFNKWFNEEFNRQKIDENEKGYSDWLKSDDGFITITSKSKKGMENELDEKKKKLQQIIVYNGIEELPIYSSYSGNLLGDPNEINNFSSTNIFSKFKYQDLKQAYEESIIPVTFNDYEKIPKYKSVNDYKQERDKPIETISEFEQKNIINNKNKIMDEKATKNAFYYSKQMEEYNKRRINFIGNLMRLKN